jgi:hypothetical protein
MSAADQAAGSAVDDAIESVLPWYRRRAGLMVGAVALVLVVFAVSRTVRTAGPRHASQPTAATSPPPTPIAPAPSAPAPPPPAAPEPVPPASVAPPAPSAVAVTAAPEKAPAAEPVPVAVAEPPRVPAKDEPPVGEAAPKEDAPEPADTALKPRRAAPPMVAVTFKTDPEGARVATRTHVYGTTPQPAKLSPGTTYELTFTKAGYVPLAKKYVAPPTATGPTTLRVSLKKLPQPSKATGRNPPKVTTPPAPASSTPKKSWFSR